MQQTRAIAGMGQPSNNPFASASLYVGDLANDVTEATLFELFNAVGPVASIRVCRDATTRRSLGYAYVNFHSVQDAERALDTMNFTNIRGKQCRIMWSQRDPRLRQSGKGNIFVKNLHDSIDNKTLYDTFSVFGNILSCKVVVDKDSQMSRGYGYVHYVDDNSAKKAIEGVNGMTISERLVHAELFKPREERIKSFKFTNVYVKYIPAHWSREQLTNVFEEATGGKVTNLELWAPEYGTSACLNFEDPDSAKRAVELLNGKDIASFGVPEPEKEEKDDAETTAEEKPKEADTESAAKEDEEKKADGDSTADGDALKNMKSEYEAKADEDGEPKAPQGASPLIPTKLYVARAQKKKERKEYLQRQQKKRGMGARRNYTGANLYVKNLSPDVDDPKLNEMFVTFGTITSAKVMREASGKSRGFGFVAFEKKEAATRAIHEMTNTLHHGKPLYVSRAQTKAFRQTFIMKQLRNKRIRTSMQQTGGGGGQQQQQQQQNWYQQQQQQQGGQQGSYGGYGRGGPPSYGRGQGPPSSAGPHGQQAHPQMMMHNPQAMMMQNPQMYGMNPMARQQLAAQQLAAQQLAAQQRAMQQQQSMGHAAMQHQAMAAQQLQQSMQNMNIQPAAAQSSIAQLSSINQAAHQRSQSMGQTQQSNPAQSMQSGPQSASIYAGSASIPRPSGLTASQQMVQGAVASQPHVASVPTGQHSVSQLSAGAGGQTSAPMLEVNPLTSEMLQDAKPAEKKRLIGERLFPKIQVVEPRLAGKITGMLLEMDNTELLVLLSEQRALMNKINEALAVLKDHQQKQSQQNPGSTKNPSSQNPGVGSATN